MDHEYRRWDPNQQQGGAGPSGAGGQGGGYGDEGMGEDEEFVPSYLV